MRDKPRDIADEDLDDYARERVKAVSDLFPIDRLKSFGLTMRECYFVKSYCVLLNAKRSAMIAGYNSRFVKNAYLLLRKEKIAQAIEVVTREALNPVTDLQTMVNVKTTVSRLMKIVIGEDPKASVMAAKTLLEYMGSGIISSPVNDDPKMGDVSDAEINKSLARMGAIANG